jgi:hypothetical protein|tara:strand:+ start:554 stop:742 length:189 start_codon:yes stop_codon:yes gene_type:complete
MMSDFNERFNPFRGLYHDELVIAYLQFTACDDVEAVALVCDAYDEDTYLDLTPFGISTRDFQ